MISNIYSNSHCLVSLLCQMNEPLSLYLCLCLDSHNHLECSSFSTKCKETNHENNSWYKHQKLDANLHSTE